MNQRFAALRLRQRIVVLLAACSLCGSLQLRAEDDGAFQLSDRSTRLVDTTYLLDAQFIISLSAGAQEALENGVPLVFELQVQLVKTHPWFWDSIAAEYKLDRELQYHPLSRSYLVKDLHSATQNNYLQLEDALLAVGDITALPLIEVKRLARDRLYKVRLRGNLDIESLPTPVRLLAYVSSAWDMPGEWYAWPLAR